MSNKKYYMGQQIKKMKPLLFSIILISGVMQVKPNKRKNDRHHVNANRVSQPQNKAAISEFKLIDKLLPSDFEIFVRDVFVAAGWNDAIITKVGQEFQHGDGGVDIFAYKSKRKFAIEVKQRQAGDTVDVSALNQLVTGAKLANAVNMIYGVGILEGSDRWEGNSETRPYSSFTKTSPEKPSQPSELSEWDDWDNIGGIFASTGYGNGVAAAPHEW